MLPPDVMKALMDFVTTQQQIRDAVILQNCILLASIAAQLNTSPEAVVDHLLDPARRVLYPSPIDPAELATPE